MRYVLFMGSKNLSACVLCGNLVVKHLTASVSEEAETILTYVEVDHAVQMVNYYVSESNIRLRTKFKGG